MLTVTGMPNGIVYADERFLILIDLFSDDVKNDLNKIVEFFLSHHTNAEDETLLSAFRMIGLGELVEHMEDATLRNEINDALVALDQILRDRQNARWRLG